MLHAPSRFPIGLASAWRETTWVFRFSIICLGALAALIALCWIVFGFGSLNLDPTATFAAVLGIGFTVLLGVGLMALVFYSDRSGQDDIASATPLDRDDE